LGYLGVIITNLWKVSEFRIGGSMTVADYVNNFMDFDSHIWAWLWDIIESIFIFLQSLPIEVVAAFYILLAISIGLVIWGIITKIREVRFNL